MTIRKRLLLENKIRTTFFHAIFVMLLECLKLSLKSDNFKHGGDISKISAKKMSSFFSDEVFLSGLDFLSPNSLCNIFF